MRTKKNYETFTKKEKKKKIEICFQKLT